ncbi:alpha-latrotoxin-Lg1a-like [Hydra vulgaris]|uniref:alpha-latrotoxin-Lg1a-like n=1 Tax=Hydra vulgaris TaxID=6087 RepID=UPI0032E9D877
MNLENYFENNNFLIKPSTQVYYITAILKKYGYKNGENKVDFAASIGKNDIITLLIQLGYKGHLEVVKYLHSIGYREECSIDYAASNGHLEVVKYLHSIGYRVEGWTITCAAINGHLEVVKYLHSIGYRGTRSAVYYAAENGHLEVVKYLIELGYECDEWIINDVERKGKNAKQLLKVLIDLHSIGYKGTEKAIFHAKLAGYLEAFEYLRSIGHRYS